MQKKARFNKHGEPEKAICLSEGLWKLRVDAAGALGEDTVESGFTRRWHPASYNMSASAPLVVWSINRDLFIAS